MPQLGQVFTRPLLFSSRRESPGYLHSPRASSAPAAFTKPLGLGCARPRAEGTLRALDAPAARVQQRRVVDGGDVHKVRIEIDGQSISVAAGTPIDAILGAARIHRQGIVGALLDNHLVSLATPVDGNARLRPIAAGSVEPA